MRCNECNVDLGESYHICPLCGAKAADEPPRLEGLEEAPYPDVSKSVEEEWLPDRPSKAVFRVLAVLSVLLTLFGGTFGAAVVSPLLLGVCALYYFVGGCREPGRLLHAGLSSFLTLLLSAGLLIAALVRQTGVWQCLLSFVFCAMFFAILCVLYPARMKAQFEATLHR